MCTFCFMSLSEKGRFYLQTGAESSGEDDYSSDEGPQGGSMALSVRGGRAPKETSVCLFRAYETECPAFSHFADPRRSVVLLFKTPTMSTEDMFRKVLHARVDASVSTDEDDGIAVVEALGNLGSVELRKNYSWVYSMSCSFKICSGADDYVTLTVDDGLGTAMVSGVHDGRPEGEFRAFVEKTSLNAPLSTVLFPHFLFLFIEHFTLMFFSVTLALGNAVPEIRFKALAGLWIQVSDRYVKCVDMVKSRLGNMFVELPVLCYQLRMELTDGIHAQRLTILGDSSWETRFEVFKEAVVDSMNMHKFIRSRSESLFDVVAPSIVNMSNALARANEKNQDLERQVKKLTSEFSHLAEVTETDAASSDALSRVDTAKANKRGRMDRT